MKLGYTIKHETKLQLKQTVKEIGSKRAKFLAKRIDNYWVSGKDSHGLFNLSSNSKTTIILHHYLTAEGQSTEKWTHFSKNNNNCFTKENHFVSHVSCHCQEAVSHMSMDLYGENPQNTV
ncbi:hypothetical protein NPIL_191311 [Nephila pilipes]|uniref:Uncharacterized protein n=1 Tax=Nephila pilipes TaxID=299642 RepID=A0A8X6UCI2_NEPPI|nr:hypothetical protein NPIL_191311 [Nephila pilipes]